VAGRIIKLSQPEELMMLNRKIVESSGDRSVSPLKPTAFITLIVVCVTMATAQVFFGADEPPPAFARQAAASSLTVAAIGTPNAATTCAGGVSDEECDYGLEPTLTPAIKPNLGKRTGLVLASAGKTSVRPGKVKSSIQQANPENQIVGCAGGEGTSGNDCM
jgi:hypothetical protein